MNRSYVTVMELNRYAPNNSRYEERTHKGYKINDIFSAYHDHKPGYWNLVHTPTMSTVASCNTLSDCNVVSYAFLPHDMQHAIIEDNEYLTWNDNTARYNSRDSWHALRYESDLIH